MCSIFLTKPHC